MKSYIRGFVVLVALAVHGIAWSGGSVDAGRSYFQPGVAPGFGLCLQCHFDAPTAPRFVPARFNPAYLSAAFGSVLEMNPNLTILGSVGIRDVATYLGFVGQGRPDVTDADRLFDWGEDTFPQLLSPRRQVTGELLGFAFRYYPDTGVYVGIKDGSVHYYDSRAPGGDIQNLGTVRSFLEQLPAGQ